MMKTTRQDNWYTVPSGTDIGQGCRYMACVTLALLAACSVSVQAEQTFPASTGSATLLVNGKLFPADGHFPQSGFTGATFQVLANGHDAQDNARYQWGSNQSWVTVDKDGTVTFTRMPAGESRAVILTATPVAKGPTLALPFSLSRWFINAKAEMMARPAAEAWCQAQGSAFALPEAAAMTTPNKTPAVRAANGALWSEWGPMALYRSGWQLGNYWGGKTQGDKREMVGLVNGDFYWVPDSSKYLVTCVRDLQ